MRVPGFRQEGIDLALAARRGLSERLPARARWVRLGHYRRKSAPCGGGKSRRSRLLAVVVVGWALVVSRAGSAQSLPSPPEQAIAPSAEQSEFDHLHALLVTGEASFTERQDSFQSRFGWRLDQLRASREALSARIVALEQERESLDRLRDSEQRRLISEVMAAAQELVQRISLLEQAYDARLLNLLDGASLARHLRIDLEEGESVDEPRGLAAIDRQLAPIERVLASLHARHTELSASREDIERALEAHREQLDTARDTLLQAELAESQDQVGRDAATDEATTGADGVSGMAHRLADRMVRLRQQGVRDLALGLVREAAVAWVTCQVIAPSAVVGPPVWLAPTLSRSIEAVLPLVPRDATVAAVAVARLNIERTAAEAAPRRLQAAQRAQSLQALHMELLRLDVQLRDRLRELDRERIEAVNLEVEKLAVQIPALEYQRDRLLETRVEAAAREGGILAADPSPFDLASIRALTGRTAELASDPAAIGLALARSLSERPKRPFGAGLALLLILVVGAAFLLSRAGRSMARRWSLRRGLDPARLRGLRLGLHVLPASAAVMTLVVAELLPPPLERLAWVLASVPLVLAAVSLVINGRFPRTGNERLSADRTRRLRRVLYGVLWIASALLVLAGLLPLLAFPSNAVQPIWGVLVVAAAVAVLIVLARQRRGRGRAKGAIGNLGLLRRGIRRLFPLLALLIVALVGLYLVGYRNLAAVVFRRGLIVLALLLWVPWGHGRAHWLIRRLLAFPDGGGPLSLSRTASRIAYRSLAPVLTLVVGALALAVLASVWGLEGGVTHSIGRVLHFPLLTIGDSAITPQSIVLFGFTIVATVVASRWFVALVRDDVYPLYDLTAGMRQSFDTLLRYALLLVGIAVGLRVIGVGLGVFAVFAGVIGIGIGFGSQTLAANFISGLILQFSKPINVGDLVEVQGVVGRVMRISSYATIIKTFDSLSVIVPNSAFIGEAVLNWTEGERFRRFAVNVGVAYGSDVERVTALLLEVAAAHEGVLVEPPPAVRFEAFGESSLDFVLLVWTDMPEHLFVLASELRYRIDATFRQNDVEIPFPQRDLHLRTGGTEALAPPAPGKPADAAARKAASSPSKRKKPAIISTDLSRP